MIRRTLFFESAGYLHAKLNQLVFVPESGEKRQVPIEDVGFVIVENQSIVLTAHCMQSLAKNNTAVVVCNASHMPSSMLFSMEGHSTTQRQTEAQLSATDALNRRLWKQTVKAKILNQARCLELGDRDLANKLRIIASNVRNGDPENNEGNAARHYFKAHFPDGNFKRAREGGMPNAVLNYGYAIIRAAMARALVGSGLLCVKGIHHTNQYNPFVLADDIMEPYRPFADNLILNSRFRDAAVLDKEIKLALAMLPASDVVISGMKRPMMNAMSMTSASLARCYLKKGSEILYPGFAQCLNTSPPSTTTR